MQRTATYHIDEREIPICVTAKSEDHVRIGSKSASPEARQKYIRKRSRRSATIGAQLGCSIDQRAVVRPGGAAICYHRAMPPPRRFPPWSIEERQESFIVKDANGQELAYLYFEDEPQRGGASPASAIFRPLT